MLNGFHKYYGFRGFAQSQVGTDSGKSKPPPPQPDDPPTSNSTGVVKMTFSPSAFDKKILVWSGRYKTANEIPDRISYDTLDNARSRVRIKMANLLMLGTIGLCGYYIYQGKKSLHEGDTIRKRILDRDQKVLEEYRKKKGE